MSWKPHIRVPATYMRGGTSKGVFFARHDLPEAAQQPGPARDALLLRVLGSPDSYARQIDGMGGATSSTSKAVIVDRSRRQDHDVDYLFGQVAIDRPLVDWSGNCGNLTAAVAAFAISQGLVDQERIPEQGLAVVRIWQVNIQKSIVVRVPIVNGQVREAGDFELAGVAFPGAEIAVEFVDPAGEEAMFPTGHRVDDLEVPGVGNLKATLINAGIPTIFVLAQSLGYTGTEPQQAINGDPQALARCEAIRAHGALKMGLITTLEEAAQCQHTPKLAWVAAPLNYTTAGGKYVPAHEVDLLVRALSMGQLHHAMMGTAAVALGVAAAVPGTLVHRVAGGGERQAVCFGHPSGTLKVGAQVQQVAGRWVATQATISRTARVLMEGWVRVPAEVLEL